MVQESFKLPDVDPDDKLQALNFLWALEEELLLAVQSVRDWALTISNEGSAVAGFWNDNSKRFESLLDEAYELEIKLGIEDLEVNEERPPATNEEERRLHNRLDEISAEIDEIKAKEVKLSEQWEEESREKRQQIVEDARKLAYRHHLLKGPRSRPLKYSEERRALLRQMRRDLKARLKNLQRSYEGYRKRGLSQEEAITKLVEQRLPTALLFSTHGLLERAMTGSISHATAIYDYLGHLTGSPAKEIPHYLKPSRRKPSKREVD